VSVNEDRYSKARAAAEALFRKDKQRAAAAVSKKKKEQDDTAKKTQRLRDLRLAKEAAEQVEATRPPATRRRPGRWEKT